MKKLIPALCMLLVAACLMGTSTYAWFAANETVTASGMQVKAASDGGLGIAVWGFTDTTASRPALDAYSGTATLDNSSWTNQLGITNPTIRPTSLNPTNAGAWYKASSATTSNGSAAADEDGNLYFAVDNGAQYYQASQFSIRSLKEAATGDDNIDLKLASIKITGSSNTEALNKSLRVALYVYADPLYATPDNADDDAAVPTNGQWYVFAPYNASATGVYVESATEADATYATNHFVAVGGTKDATTGVITANTNLLIYDNLTAAPIVVQVYVYYDGMDENCKSDNLSINVDTLQVELGFSTK